MNRVAIAIEVVILDYQHDSGKHPAGILLGPLEYRELCYFVNQNSKHMKDAQVEEGLVVQYLGYPVYLKELPGVELMLSYQEAFNASYR